MTEDTIVTTTHYTIGRGHSADEGDCYVVRRHDVHRRNGMLTGRDVRVIARFPTAGEARAYRDRFAAEPPILGSALKGIRLK